MTVKRVHDLLLSSLLHINARIIYQRTYTTIQRRSGYLHNVAYVEI